LLHTSRPGHDESRGDVKQIRSGSDPTAEEREDSEKHGCRRIHDPQIARGSGGKEGGGGREREDDYHPGRRTKKSTKKRTIHGGEQWTQRQCGPNNNKRGQTESVMRLNNWLSRRVQSCCPPPSTSYDHRENVTAHDKVTCAPTGWATLWWRGGGGHMFNPMVSAPLPPPLGPSAGLQGERERR